MAMYNGKKSRAPLIPYSDPDKAAKGELVVKQDDSGAHILVKTEDEQGQGKLVDLVQETTKVIEQEMKDTKDMKFSKEEPSASNEQVWLKVETFDNDTETMKQVSEYGPNEEVDML